VRLAGLGQRGLGAVAQAAAGIDLAEPGQPEGEQQVNVSLRFRCAGPE
jgi:hypothetical protein